MIKTNLNAKAANITATYEVTLTFEEPGRIKGFGLTDLVRGYKAVHEFSKEQGTLPQKIELKKLTDKKTGEAIWTAEENGMWPVYYVDGTGHVLRSEVLSSSTAAGAAWKAQERLNKALQPLFVAGSLPDGPAAGAEKITKICVGECGRDNITPEGMKKTYDESRFAAVVSTSLAGGE